MENQEINLEKVHRLIASLQSQAKEGSANAQAQGMLTTAQLLVAELQHLYSNNGHTAHKHGCVSVVMPFTGKPVVSHVPLEDAASPVAAPQEKGTSYLQPPTIITETKPSEATDNHSFGTMPTPPAQVQALSPEPVGTAQIPATQDPPTPDQHQKELFTLQEEEEENNVKPVPITPLKAAEYPTSIPEDSPDIQEIKATTPTEADDTYYPDQPPVAPTQVTSTVHQTVDQQLQQAIKPVKEEPVQPVYFEQVQPPDQDNELNFSIEQDEQKRQADVQAEKRRHLAFISDNFSAWSDYGVSGEAPTLVQNRPLTKETDDSYNNSYNNSYQGQHRELNEQLGQPQEEWAQKMQSTPIENLASAIGVNDRYLYISELFRGDESMYERSIITLNKFNSFPEAHAWSERELRLKLGWDTQNPVTQQFEQLIKRRFM